MRPRMIQANPLVESVANHAALMHGPIVHCLESPDLPAGVAMHEVHLSRQAAFELVALPAPLDQLRSLRGEVVVRPGLSPSRTAPLYGQIRDDRNHLILGDRYEAARPNADEVMEAAKPYMDVLSFQHFAKPEAVSQNLADWHHKTGQPVLLADHAISIKSPDGGQRHDGAGYAATLRRLRDVSGCVGYHLCGAYLRNECRQRALRDAAEKPDAEALAAITAANAEADRAMRAATGRR